MQTAAYAAAYYDANAAAYDDANATAYDPAYDGAYDPAYDGAYDTTYDAQNQDSTCSVMLLQLDYPNSNCLLTGCWKPVKTLYSSY